MRQVRHQEKRAARPNESKMIGDMPRDPNLHYVLIEKPSTAVPGYRPPYSEYKAQGYVKVTDDPSATGKDELELWAVPKDKFNRAQKAIEDESLQSAARGATPGDGTFESTVQNAPMTIDQLSASAANVEQ